MPITAANPFKWRHYPGDITMWCVRWYLRYPISVAQMGEMTRERGLAISPSCVRRWVQTYGPELDKRCRPHLKPTNRSWRVDEGDMIDCAFALQATKGWVVCLDGLD